MLFTTILHIILSLAISVPCFAAPIPNSALDCSGAISLGKWGKKPPPPTRFQRATAWLKPKKKPPPTRIQRIVAAVKPAPKKEKKKIDWDKHLTRAQRGLSTGLKATSIAVKTTMLFNTREDPELVAGILRRAAEQELERRGVKDAVKKMVGKAPPPKKTVWQKVKSIGKKKPPPTPMQKAKTKVKAALSPPWQKKEPPPSKAKKIRTAAWTTFNNGLDMFSTAVDLTRLQKTLRRRDPELSEEIMRHAKELARHDELERRDLEGWERRDLAPLLLRETELDELD
ncbi:hypothetical protein C8Q72DRAFT_385536 [Fomitopsis betulina]|nr:hypothetical protein C8Q72DRAFT_385536 [Fomitopsis betulina]